MSRYDLIGDVHGYADQLCRLLKRLGYEQRASVYSHPNRAAVFLGDFVDRGEWSIQDALRVAELIGRGNAERIYRLRG